MGDEFDFIKAFADVDLLQVEAVGMVVGRAIGAVHQGMTLSGLSEGQADAVIRCAVAELFRSVRP